MTFNEYLLGSKLNKTDAFNKYIRYGGISLVQLALDNTSKSKRAISIVNETYIKDLELRHPRMEASKLEESLKVIASMISTPINPIQIENTFKSTYHINLSNDTISKYITWFEEAYLLNRVFRYDIKGRKYIISPYKVYFEDIGIRNAILNFREIDETDLIENIVYNELRYRGFNIDVGAVKIKAKTSKLDKNNKPIYIDKDAEVDFIDNKGNKTYYIQVALEISNNEKKEQEYL